MTRGVVDPLLMSRLDFDVHVLDIPPVPDKEIAGLIKLKLRSVYPGNPQDTAFDYHVVRRGAVRRAIVFVSRRKTVDAYREAAGRRPLVLPYQLILPRVPKKGAFRAWILHGDWAECLVFHDSIPVCSIVKRLTRGTRFDLETGEDSVRADLRSGSVVVAAPAEQLEQMVKRDGAAYLLLEDLRPGRWRPEGLFHPEQHRAVPGHRIRLLVLAAIAVVLGFLLLFKYVSLVEARADRLSKLADSLENSNQKTLDAQRDIGVLRVERARLESLSTSDIYLLLSDLSLVIGQRARIVGMSVRDGSFQLDAVGSDPLELMEDFKRKEVFADITLSQVVPDGTSGRERFSVVGAYHGR